MAFDLLTQLRSHTAYQKSPTPPPANTRVLPALNDTATVEYHVVLKQPGTDLILPAGHDVTQPSGGALARDDMTPDR